MSNTRYDYCIGSADTSFKKTVTSILNRAGYQSAGDAKNVSLFLRLLRTVQPWLAVLDTDLPPGNIQELAEIIKSDNLSAAIYLNKGKKTINQCVVLNWPVEESVLVAVANAVSTEFAHKKKMHQEIASLQKIINERKIIEKAKAILISRHHLNEEEAFSFLRKTSMDKRITLTETALIIINDPGYFFGQSPHR